MDKNRNEVNLNVLEHILCMSINQLNRFKKIYNYLRYTNNNIFVDYYDQGYSNFSIITEEYEEFNFYRNDDKDEIDCYYIINYEVINFEDLKDLYYDFSNLGVYIKFNDDCELEGIAEVDHEDNVDLELVDFIKWLREYNDVDRIKWGCSDFTKNIYMKILGD